MKHVSSYGAYKKVKKHIHKYFDGEIVTELQSLLSDQGIKHSLKILDTLSTPVPDIPHEDQNLTAVISSTIDLLYTSVLSVDQNDVEVNALVQLLSSPHLRAFAEAYTEVSGKTYNMPELPESAIFAISGAGTYGTMGSLMASQGSKMLLHDRVITSRQSIENMNAYTDSPFGLTAGGYDGQAELRRTQATLTGGGFGPALPPVEGTVKIISFEKHYGEDMGITVVPQQYRSAHYGLVKELVVKRILTASRIEQQGLLHEGDVIREANGVPVNTPEMLQRVLRNAVGTVTLKIIPGYQPKTMTSQLFLKAYFTYNPKNDNLIPCKEAGLPFVAGDVLQVLKQEDPYWWQARHYGHQQRAGLIPSVVLQERRRAYVQSAASPEEATYKMVACGLARRRRKEVVIPFRARDAENFEMKDLVLYEEVALISGFQRPVICLIGADGVGRRSLRNMLIRAHPDRYGKALLHTSREQDPDDFEDENGFILENDIKMQKAQFENKFLEFGEFEGHYYGTKFDSVRDVINSGRTCVLDCSIHAVSKIRNAEFMPYVILLAAPSVSCMKAMYEYGMSMGFSHKWKRDENFRRTLNYSQYLEQNYRHLFDHILLCDNIEVNFDQLSQIVNDLTVQPQWVPARWLY